MPEARAQQDANQVYSQIGVRGTLGTADIMGTAGIVPIGADPATGAQYVYNLGPAGEVTLGDITGGTINLIGSISTIGTMPAISIGESTGGTLDLVGTVGELTNGTVRVTAGTVGTIGAVGQIHNAGTVQGGTINIASFSYYNITGQIGGTIKEGAGVLHTISVNKPVANGVIKLFDGAIGANPIAVITRAGTLLSDAPTSSIYDVSFSTRLSVETQNADQDITVTYR